MTRQYYGIEDLGLTAGQRNTLVELLKGLGRDNQHKQPNYRNHWRIRLDNKAVIFEGNFDDEDWTIQNIKAKLASVFGIDPGTITHDLVDSNYGPVVTFSRNGARLRMVAFGGLLASWFESWMKVLAYLKANTLDWEEIIE